MALPPKKRQSLVPYSDDDEEVVRYSDEDLVPYSDDEEEEERATPTTEEEEEVEACLESVEEDERRTEAEGGAAAASGSSPELSPSDFPPAPPFSYSPLLPLPAPGFRGLLRKPIWDKRGERSMACSTYPPLIGSTYLRPMKRATPAEVEEEEEAMAGSMPPPSIGGTYPPLASEIPAEARKNALEEERGSSIVDFAAREVIKLTPHTAPLVGDKEAIFALAVNWQTEDPIIQKKMKTLTANYVAFRRVRGDGSGFYRSFTLSYLEHIHETQDKAEIQRISSRIQECMKTWHISLQAKIRYKIFWDRMATSILRTSEGIPWSHEELLRNCREQPVSDALVLLFRKVISGEMRAREDFFRPFIALGPGETMDQFYSSVEDMGQDCDHVHIAALSDALRLPIRVVYLDRTLARDDSSPKLNQHDFFPSAESCRAGSSSTAAAYPSQSGRPEIGAIALNPPGNDAAKNRGFDGGITLASNPTNSRRRRRRRRSQRLRIIRSQGIAALNAPRNSDDSVACIVPAQNSGLDASMIISCQGSAASTSTGVATSSNPPSNPPEGAMNAGDLNIGNPPEGAMNVGDLSIDNPPVPFVTLLHRPGHYDILYPKGPNDSS